MDVPSVRKLVDTTWDGEILPVLQEYIQIPNRSPVFDRDWKRNGHMDRAVELVARWCRRQPIEGLSVEILREGDRTPLLYMEVPGATDETVLLYGHLDKQPEMTGWSEGLGPWTPVLRGDRLYGRGGADDGYAAFAALTAIRAADAQRVRRARCVLLIECCEESGSFDLPFYVERLAARIGTPSLVICLDSGCGNYDQLWCTTSLRGAVVGDLRVDILREGVHSGDASGIVPSSFRILRELLSRLEDESTGAIRPESLHVEIPAARVEQAQGVARALGDEIWSKFPWVEGAAPVTKDPLELILNRTWRPALSITGASGMPALADAGNVLRPFTAVKVSFRTPPSLSVDRATATLKELFESAPPYGAHVTFAAEKASPGWNAAPLEPWLEEAIQESSRAWFGREAVFMGEGGSIPFMAMLGERYPDAQFLITGVLGPHSNAHGPNEFLHLPTARRLTGCVADVLERQAAR